MSTALDTSDTSYISQSSTLLFFCCFATIFFIIFNFTVTNIASVYIVGSLGGLSTIGVYAITFFGLGNSIGIPLGYFLQSHVNLGKLFFYCMMGFSLLNFLCSISPNYPTFLICRFFAGVAAGPLYALVQRTLFLFSPLRKKKEFMAILVIIFTTVPVLGGSFGGWIAYEYHWIYIFYPTIPFTLFIGFYFLKKLQAIPLDPYQKSLDGIGYTFYCLSILLLGSSITLGQELDWFRSPLIIGFVIAGSISFLFFIIRDLTHHTPVLCLRLLRHGILSYALLNLCIFFSSYFGMVFLLGLWLKLDANYTPVWIAILIGSMGIAGLIPRPLIVAKKLGKIDVRIPLGIAIILLAISCFHTTIFDVEINLGRIASTRIVAGFALALFLPPLFRLAFHSFSEELSPRILNIFQVTRSLSSALGASIYTTIWERRTVFYHERLGSQLTLFSEQTKDYFVKAKQFHLTKLNATFELNHFLDRRSSSLALDDCFFLMSWILVALFAALLASFFCKEKNFSP